MIIKKNKYGNKIKIKHKKVKPIQNLLNIFFLKIKKKSNNNDLIFSYKVMNVLFKIHKELNKTATKIKLIDWLR